MKKTLVKLTVVACIATGLTACSGYYGTDGYSYSEVDRYDVPSSTVVWSDWHRYHHHRQYAPSVTVSGRGGQAHYGPPRHHDHGGGAHYGPPHHASANNDPHYGPPSGGHGGQAHYGPPGGGVPHVSVG